MHDTNDFAPFHPRRDGGLSLLSEMRLRDELRMQTPSEPWVDAQIIEIVGADERGVPTIRRIHDPSAFPPGGAQTLMVRCRLCNILTPPFAMENGVCLDHREDGPWGRSPSAVAIQTLHYRNSELPQKIELEDESEEGLQREIASYAMLHPSVKNARQSPK